MTESIQKKLLRVRPPRVRITYDVETGGALEKRELPFIVGIFADLAGDVPADRPLPALKDRKMHDIDRDNFNDVLKTMTPRVDLVPVLHNEALAELKHGGNPADLAIVFKSLDDFDPLAVVQALPTLNAKYIARGQIRNLQTKAESDDAIAAGLDAWIEGPDPDALATLQQALLDALAHSTVSDKAAQRFALFSLQQKVLATESPAAALAAATAAAAAAIVAIPAATLDSTNAAARKTAADAASATAKTASDKATADAAAAPTDDNLKKAADEAAATAAAAAKTAAAAATAATAAATAVTTATTQKTAADAALTLAKSDPAAAQTTAKGSAVAVLQEWALLPAGKIDLALPLDNARFTSASLYAQTLGDALAQDDTPENRKSVNDLLAALSDAGTPSATSTDADLARYKKRDDAIIRLGGAANAASIVAIVGTPDPAAPSGDAAWVPALLLLGLVAEDNPAAIDADAYTDDREYQEDRTNASARETTLQFASYLSHAPQATQPAAGAAAATPPDNRLLVTDAVLPLVSLLQGNQGGIATARVLLRLKYFATQILTQVQNKNPDLLRVLKKGATALIDEQVTLIDQQLSAALSCIMHSNSFKTAEQTWRGLAYLVFNTETSTMLKLRLFNASKEALRKDMEKAVEFDQSALFKMIYEAEYGTYGGFPYSLLIGGYEIGSGNEDVVFLKKMAEVAAAAHAPFIAAASIQLFGLTSFNKLDKPRDLAKIFEADELIGWREFRDMEDARYVSLVLPRALLRLPYGSPVKRNTIQCEGINFEEQVSDNGAQPRLSPAGDTLSYPTPANDNFLWGNAAYLLAERITNAFSLYSWTAAIRGVEGGGLVEGLPVYTYTTDSGTTELFCPTEVSITDRREKELNDLGFISLCHCKGTGMAAFFGGQTTNAPKKYFSDDANANARISAMLPYMLAASRFAHYIKVIMRDKIGSFLTRANVESYLNTWISNYVLLDDNASQEIKASYPLRAASVVVTEVPGEPGAYKATAFLKPHFQLEELTVSIRLVANLPK